MSIYPIRARENVAIKAMFICGNFDVYVSGYISDPDRAAILLKDNSDVESPNGVAATINTVEMGLPPLPDGWVDIKSWGEAAGLYDQMHMYGLVTETEKHMVDYGSHQVKIYRAKLADDLKARWDEWKFNLTADKQAWNS